MSELGWAKWEAFSLVGWMEEICGMIQYWGVSEYQLSAHPRYDRFIKRPSQQVGRRLRLV